MRIYVTNTGLAAERACGRAVKLLTQVPNTPHLEYETQAHITCNEFKQKVGGGQSCCLRRCQTRPTWNMKHKHASYM